MIIIRIMGGLGNQLFQYAAAYSLARQHNTFVVHDISFYQGNYPLKNLHQQYNVDHLRQLGMNDQQIANEIFYRSRLEELTIKNLNPAIQLPNTQNPILNVNINGINQQIQFTNYNYTDSPYNPSIWQCPDNTILTGYFESHHYSHQYRGEFCEQFQYNGAWSAVANEYARKIKNTPFAVGLNIRLGDKVHIPLFHINFKNYIGRAMNLMKQLAQSRGAQPKLFIFCGDPKAFYEIYADFCHEHQGQFELVVTQSAMFDFELMKLMNGLILTHSTFGWWAAYLNNQPQKIVIAPNLFFNGMEAIKTEHNRLDYYPDDFILLPISRFKEFQ